MKLGAVHLLILERAQPRAKIIGPGQRHVARDLERQGFGQVIPGGFERFPLVHLPEPRQPPDLSAAELEAMLSLSDGRKLQRDCRPWSIFQRLSNRGLIEAQSTEFGPAWARKDPK